MTFFNSDISCDDNNLQLPGFDLMKADHPSNTKRGGVCICYRNFLPLKLINIHYLNECITFEVKLGDKICNFVSLCRSPNQSEDDFENFCNNFELTLLTVSRQLIAFYLSSLVISTQSLATGILTIQLPLKALKLRP